MTNPFANPLPIPQPLKIESATIAEIDHSKRWARTFLLVVGVVLFGGFWLPTLLVLGKLATLWPVMVICAIALSAIGEVMIRNAANSFAAMRATRE